MSLNFADLVVLGDDISGVMAASLLAKRGLNVLIVDRPTPKRPASLAGLDNRGFKSFMGKLGVPQNRIRSLERNDTSFQIILPNHRIDVTPEREKLLEEFEREFPKHCDWARTFFEEVEAAHEEEARPLLQLLPWHSWREKRRFIKMKRENDWPRWSDTLEELPPDLRTFFKAWIQFLSGNPIGFTDAIQPLFLLAEENSSTIQLRGGWHELKHLFYERIEYYGGTILPEPPADYSLQIESSRVKGIDFSGYHFTTGCRYLLGNDTLPDLMAHLPKGFRTRRYHRQMNRTPAARELKIQFLIDSSVLPEPMCQNVLMVQDASKPLLGTNYLAIEVIKLPKPPDPSEDALLEVTYFLPATETCSDDPQTIENFEARHEEIEQSLRRLIPFSGGRMRRLFPLSRSETTELFDESEDDYSTFFDSGRRAVRYPPSYNFPSLVTPYDNLLTLGRDHLSWLGLAGRMHGAMKAIDHIWSQESKIRNI